MRPAKAFLKNRFLDLLVNFLAPIVLSLLLSLFPRQNLTLNWHDESKLRRLILFLRIFGANLLETWLLASIYQRRKLTFTFFSAVYTKLGL